MTLRTIGILSLSSKKVHTIVHLASHYNETSEYAQWHIPETHFLEMWGDARAFDGTYSVIQPLISPLYRAHTAFEVLSGVLRQTRCHGLRTPSAKA